MSDLPDDLQRAATRPARSAAARFAVALDLYELGETMLRHKLRRQNPDASDAEIEAHIQAWLETRPGAEHGDCIGRVRPWPPKT